MSFHQGPHGLASLPSQHKFLHELISVPPQASFTMHFPVRINNCVAAQGSGCRRENSQNTPTLKVPVSAALSQGQLVVTREGSPATVLSLWALWGQGLVWVGITDFCSLAFLQHRAPPQRTPCSRPTLECSSMQDVSIHAASWLFHFLYLDLHIPAPGAPSSPDLVPALHKGGRE